MKQNKYFNPGRFARLLRNDLMINQKMYFFTLVSFGIVLYAISYFLMRTSTKFRDDEYIVLFMLNLVVMGVIIGTAFPALSNPVKKGNYLLMPGSTLEKYLVQFVIRIVIFIPIALLIFWVCMHLAKASLFFLPGKAFNLSGYIPDFHFSILYNLFYYKDIAPILFGIFSGYSLLFAGSAYFKRFALPKTLIFFGIIVGMVPLAFLIFSYLFFPASANGFDIVLPIYKINSDTDNFKLFFYIIFGCPWLFFLPLAYFKLKEKEV